MNCHEVDQFLQELLDGAMPATTPEIDRHLSECLHCQELADAARMLEIGLPRPPEPSPALTNRIVGAVLADRRRRGLRRYRLTVLAAAAAAALLIVPLLSFVVRQPAAPEPVAPVVEVEPDMHKPKPALGPRIEQAGFAVVAATDRLTEKTREHAQILWQAAAPMEMLPVAEFARIQETDEAEFLRIQLPDPAAQSLQQTSAGVSDGLQIVTNSARRAVSFFAGEMPTLRPRQATP